MRVKAIFSWIFLFSASAMLAIGSVYDERIELFDINISILFSAVYIVSVIIIITSVKSFLLGKSKTLVFLFFIICIIITPILWRIYGYGEYGILKYLNFILIVIPITFIISNRFKYIDMIRFFRILFCVSATLGILGTFILSDTYGSLSVLGGGPIVFARWMCFAILILLFMPVQYNYKLRIVLSACFFILALSAGSRGPIVALLFTLGIFIMINFKRIVHKLILLFLILTCGFMFSSLGKDIMKIGSVDRIFMNISSHGIVKQSTVNPRFEFMNRSWLLMKEHPLGIGCGNWRAQANIINKQHLMAHPYPHNLIFEIANEYGFFAIVIFMLLLLKVISLAYNKLIKNKHNKSSLYPLLFYSFIFFSLNSTVSGDLLDARILFVIIAMIVSNEQLILLSDEK